MKEPGEAQEIDKIDICLGKRIPGTFINKMSMKMSDCFIKSLTQFFVEYAWRSPFTYSHVLYKVNSNDMFRGMWNANLMQQGNFSDIFLALHVSGTYAHHQEY